jgi:hypothetical protein
MGVAGPLEGGCRVGGARTLAHDAYRRSLRAQGPRARAGGRLALEGDSTAADRAFFLAYARMWRVRFTDEVLRDNLRNAYHAPGMVRVNGTVRNLDAWHAAFRVTPARRLYLPPARRVTIWWRDPCREAAAPRRGDEGPRAPPPGPRCADRPAGRPPARLRACAPAAGRWPVRCAGPPATSTAAGGARAAGCLGAPRRRARWRSLVRISRIRHGALIRSSRRCRSAVLRCVPPARASAPARPALARDAPFPPALEVHPCDPSPRAHVPCRLPVPSTSAPRWR